MTSNINDTDTVRPTMPRSRVERASAIAAILTCCAIACSAAAADLRSRFDRVSFGLTREAVLAVMGTAPTTTQEASSWGLSTAKLRWEQSSVGPVFEVSFTFDRVTGKRLCDRREC